MSQATVEDRLQRLEKLMDDVLARLSASRRRKDWRKTVGMFDDDPLAGEVIEAALDAREQERLAFYEEYDKRNGQS